MTDRPIIFSGPMVRALLDGRKTQTRRVLKPQPPLGANVYWNWRLGEWRWMDEDQMTGGLVRMRHAVCDRLWVREACATWEGNTKDAAYRATMGDDNWSDLLHDARHGAPWKVRPSIHMPRWASRLTLTVTDIRVQRMQDISREDAIAEGLEWVAPTWGVGGIAESWNGDPRESFQGLWEALHGPDEWAANPWVCALTFAVHRQNIDKMGAEA